MARFPRHILAFMILAALSSTFTCKKHVKNYLGYTYRSVASHNMQRLLNALDLGVYDLKEPYRDVLRKKGKKYIYTTNQKNHHVTFKFKPNEEFSYETTYGRLVYSTISFDGPVMFEKQKDLKGNIVYIARSFTSKNLTVVMRTGSITASRFYKRDRKRPTKPVECSTEEEIDKPSTEEETEPSTEEETDPSCEKTRKPPCKCKPTRKTKCKHKRTRKTTCKHTRKSTTTTTTTTTTSSPDWGGSGGSSGSSGSSSPTYWWQWWKWCSWW